MSYNIHLIRSRKGITINSRLHYLSSIRNLYLLKDRHMAILPIPEDISCFSYFNIALFSLHARNGLYRGTMSYSDELFVEYIKGICFQPKLVRCENYDFPQPSTEASSQLQVVLAHDFMENLTGLNSSSEFRILSLLSKIYLKRILTCEDFQYKDIAPPAALVYLAALHFASSENQMVIDLCSAVLTNDTIQVGDDTLNAGCLFFIDNVVRAVGLHLIYKKLSEDMQFGKRKIYLDLRLTPVFAYYLTAKSAERLFKQFEIDLDLRASTFYFDQLVLALAKQRFGTSMKSNFYIKAASQPICKSMDPLTAIDISSINPAKVIEKLFDDLTEYAFEYMSLFYGEIRKQFSCQSNTVDCYRALYLFKSGKYNEVLLLCEDILQSHSLVNDSKEPVFGNVLVYPPFDTFFDTDVRSLLGFNTLFCYLSHLISEIRVERFTCIPNIYPYFCFSLEDPLSESFGSSYPTRCHYFVGSHFLAAYLKVRCYIDSDYPCTNAIAEFAGMNCYFPFEHIIRRFVLRKFGKFRSTCRVLSHK